MKANEHWRITRYRDVEQCTLWSNVVFLSSPNLKKKYLIWPHTRSGYNYFVFRIIIYLIRVISCSAVATSTSVAQLVTYHSGFWHSKGVIIANIPPCTVVQQLYSSRGVRELGGTIMWQSNRSISNILTCKNNYNKSVVMLIHCLLRAAVASSISRIEINFIAVFLIRLAGLQLYIFLCPGPLQYTDSRCLIWLLLY